MISNYSTRNRDPFHKIDLATPVQPHPWNISNHYMTSKVGKWIHACLNLKVWRSNFRLSCIELICALDLKNNRLSIWLLVFWISTCFSLIFPDMKFTLNLPSRSIQKFTSAFGREIGMVDFHLGDALTSRYQEMAGRHRADPGSIQIIHARILREWCLGGGMVETNNGGLVMSRLLTWVVLRILDDIGKYCGNG